jgi:hypothetical protein
MQKSLTHPKLMTQLKSGQQHHTTILKKIINACETLWETFKETQKHNKRQQASTIFT